MTENRNEDFLKAKVLAENGKLDESLEIIEPCSFEDKKETCLLCLPILENVKLMKSTRWLELYADSVYDVFNKLNRYAREEERNDVWLRLKEIYNEITLIVKKIWKEKNAPGGLEIYSGYAKLVKCYCDVADEDSFKICETYAKDAKCVGRGILEDDDYQDSKKLIETISKLVNNARQEKESLNDDD